VIDYDEDEEEDTIDYYEEYSHSGVTPIQGPIFLRNGSVPVVPLYGYQKVSNGSLLQIPVSCYFLFDCILCDILIIIILGLLMYRRTFTNQRN